MCVCVVGWGVSAREVIRGGGLRSASCRQVLGALFHESDRAIGRDLYGLLRAEGSVEMQAVAYSCPWSGAGGCIASSSVLVAGEG